MTELSPSQFKLQTEPTRLVGRLDYTRRLAFILVLVLVRTYRYQEKDLVIVSAKRVPLCFSYVETGEHLAARMFMVLSKVTRSQNTMVSYAEINRVSFLFHNDRM